MAETVARARGELVKFLDADDLLAPECLATMVAALDAHPLATMAFCRRTLLLEDPGDPAQRLWAARFGELQTRFEGLEEVNDGRRLLRQYVESGLPGNWISEPAGVLARRADLLAVGGYNRRLRQNNDMDLWLRLMARGDVVFIDRPLFEYRVAFTGVTGASTARERQWLDPLWTSEGLLGIDGFPERPVLLRARRRLLARALRRLALAPLHERREAGARAADLLGYTRFRLARAVGRAQPLHAPISV